jgi:hypothetical protein
MTKTYLENMIITILNNGHQGRINAIKCPDLIKELLTGYGLETTSVEIRSAVNTLRKNGNLIGSASGSKPHGYFMIETSQEFNDFIQQELGARLADLSWTIKAMNTAAYVRFNDAHQPTLFSYSENLKFIQRRSHG